MNSDFPVELNLLMGAARPFLKITGVERIDWCRNVADPSDPRIGPWKYRAVFDVLDDAVWNRVGEVLYFVTDAAGTLRLVGQSKERLKTRWRTSPMHDVVSRRPLGQNALFHSSTWPAIEEGISHGVSPPFVVSAIFRDELERICREAGGVLTAALAAPETKTHKLSYHVETVICAQGKQGGSLWNKQKVKRP